MASGSNGWQDEIQIHGWSRWIAFAGFVLFNMGSIVDLAIGDRKLGTGEVFIFAVSVVIVLVPLLLTVKIRVERGLLLLNVVPIPLMSSRVEVRQISRVEVEKARGMNFSLGHSTRGNEAVSYLFPGNSDKVTLTMKSGPRYEISSRNGQGFADAIDRERGRG